MATWKPGSNFDAFHSLEEEKQARIIKAAFVEFADKGFKRASTNQIAEAAHIGKGMLFYYFGSKEELYIFLSEYALAFARDKYLLNEALEASGDFIKRYRALIEAKRASVAESPEAIMFFESLYKPENQPYIGGFSSDAAEVSRLIYEKLYSGIDYSLFREDLGSGDAVKYLKWLMDGYEAETASQFKSGAFDPGDKSAAKAEWDRFYAFTEDLIRIFYK